VIRGRETFGEPKKLAEVTLTRDGDHVKGLVTRLGTTIIELSGRITGPLNPIEGSRTDFYFKFSRHQMARASTASRRSSIATAMRRRGRSRRSTVR